MEVSGDKARRRGFKFPIGTISTRASTEIPRSDPTSAVLHPSTLPPALSLFFSFSCELEKLCKFQGPPVILQLKKIRRSGSARMVFPLVVISLNAVQLSTRRLHGSVDPRAPCVPFAGTRLRVSSFRVHFVYSSQVRMGRGLGLFTGHHPIAGSISRRDSCRSSSVCALTDDQRAKGIRIGRCR